MIPFTRELANRLAETKVTVNCIHPGIIRTKLIRVLPVSWGVSVHHGASTVFNLATNPEFDGVTGKYFEEFKIARPSPVASSQRLQESLWRMSLRWAGFTIQKQPSPLNGWLTKATSNIVLCALVFWVGENGGGFVKLHQTTSAGLVGVKEGSIV